MQKTIIPQSGNNRLHFFSFTGSKKGGIVFCIEKCKLDFASSMTVELNKVLIVWVL